MNETNEVNVEKKATDQVENSVEERIPTDELITDVVEEKKENNDLKSDGLKFVFILFVILIIIIILLPFLSKIL